MNDDGSINPNIVKRNFEWTSIWIPAINQSSTTVWERYWHECLPGQETAFEISEQQLKRSS